MPARTVIIQTSLRLNQSSFPQSQILPITYGILQEAKRGGNFISEFPELLRGIPNPALSSIEEIKNRNPVALSYIPQMWEARQTANLPRRRETFDTVLYMFLRHSDLNPAKPKSSSGN